MRSFAREKSWKLTKLLTAQFKSDYHLRYISVLIVGGIMIAASVTAYLSYQSVRHLILKNLERNALLEVKQRSTLIDRWIATRKAEIEILANTPPVRSMDWSVAEPYLKSEVIRLQEFQHFALIEPDGSYFTTKVGRALANVSDRQHFQKAMAGEVYVSDPTISRTVKKQSIVPISAPIWSVANTGAKTVKRPIGVMNGVIKIDRVAKVFGKLEYGSGTYAFVLNSQGVPILHPDSRSIGNTDKPAPSFLDSTDPNLASVARKMVYKKTGILQTQIGDTKVYVAYLPLEQVEWSIALVIPQSNLKQELRSLNMLAAAAGGLLAAAAGGLILILKLLAKNRLHNRTEAVLHRLTSRIRACLNLDRILQTTVEEVATLMKLDRAIFGWYDPRHDTLEFCWEYCGQGLPSVLGVFGAAVGPTGDLGARLNECESLLLKKNGDRTATSSQESAYLELNHDRYAAVPVLTQTNRLGYLFACTNRRFANPEEVEVLEAVSDSLAIAIAQSQLRGQIQEQLKLLEELLAKLRRTEEHLVQNEKMTVLGQLVAGISREINNPINFIYGNLIHVNDYIKDLLNIIRLYSENYPEPVPEIQEEIERLDLDFVSEDLPQIINSLKIGADRIRQTIISLRHFSLPDAANKTYANIHEGIDDILLLLAYRLEKKIFVVKEYSNIPLLLCYPGQLNQVFATIIGNAIEAVNLREDSDKTIALKTDVIQYPEGRFIKISIAHNGPAIAPEVQSRIFEHSGSGKLFNKFTGLGLSICYKIVVEVHGGRLVVVSPLQFPIHSKIQSKTATGAEFVVELPIV